MIPTRRVTSPDGVSLAVTETGDPAAPAVVCVHGYPDGSAVWDGVAAELADRYHVVRYDVRGAGQSDRPRARSAYRLDRLVDDLRAVLDAVSPQRPVHLLGHDWGSVQCWHAVADERLAGRVASLTSISGPDLDHAGTWIRSGFRPGGAKLRDVAWQLVESGYIVLFCLPVLPELLWRTGLLDRVLAASARLGRGSAPAGRAGRLPRQALADKIAGLQLYRANMPRRLGRPRPRAVTIPVLVVAPSHDAFVSRALQIEAPRRWTPYLRVRTVPGGHWVVHTRPELIAGIVSEQIDANLS